MPDHVQLFVYCDSDKDNW